MSKNLRSPKNILIRPRQQLRFALYFFAASSAMIVLYIVLLLTSLNSTITLIAQQYNLPSEILPVILNSIQSSVVFVAVFGFVLTLAMLAFGVSMSHRIFGPMVPIENLLKRLKEGDYAARGSLRKNDEFQDIMTDLNELAANLQTRHGGGAVGAVKAADPS